MVFQRQMFYPRRFSWPLEKKSHILVDELADVGLLNVQSVLVFFRPVVQHILTSSSSGPLMFNVFT